MAPRDRKSEVRPRGGGVILPPGVIRYLHASGTGPMLIRTPLHTILHKPWYAILPILTVPANHDEPY